MNKRLYVDFHILQTVPPSCINRDDTGSPKTAVYGGVLRARVSSQAWKHAMRAAFAENAQLDVGKRTKKAAELVKAQILALAPELDADKLAKKALENAGIKFDEKSKKDDTVTKALFFMSTAQAKALAELAVEGSADKKQYRDALKAAPSMDMALFGRMVADDPPALRPRRKFSYDSPRSGIFQSAVLPPASFPPDRYMLLPLTIHNLPFSEVHPPMRH